jgi:hypothetical protein
VLNALEAYDPVPFRTIRVDSFCVYGMADSSSGLGQALKAAAVPWMAGSIRANTRTCISTLAATKTQPQPVNPQPDHVNLQNFDHALCTSLQPNASASQCNTARHSKTLRPTMLFPFGVSVSDFLSGIKLIKTSIEACSDTHGAQADYSELSGSLGSLQRASTAASECKRMCPRKSFSNSWSFSMTLWDASLHSISNLSLLLLHSKQFSKFDSGMWGSRKSLTSNMVCGIWRDERRLLRGSLGKASYL